MKITSVHADYGVLNSFDHIIGNITHKYSNLICPVLGFSEVLRMQNTDDALSEFINHTHDYSVLLKDFNDDLGIAVMSGASSEDIHVSASALCEESLKLVVDEAEGEFKDQIGALSFDYPNKDAKSALLVNEAETVSAILQRLLKNAFEAASEHDGSVKIQTQIINADADTSKHLGVEQRSYFVIEILSDSKRVDDAILQKALLPLFTTKDETVHKGLGLWQSFRLARSLGGTVTLTNGDDGKTCASIFLPVVSSQQRETD